MKTFSISTKKIAIYEEMTLEYVKSMNCNTLSEYLMYWHAVEKEHDKRNLGSNDTSEWASFYTFVTKHG